MCILAALLFAFALVFLLIQAVPPIQFPDLLLQLFNGCRTVSRVLFGQRDTLLQRVIGDLVSAVFKLDFQI